MSVKDTELRKPLELFVKVPQKNYVTMDGNFQSKRYKGVFNKPNGQKMPGLYDEEAEGRLWSS
ncbi:unnamed protein product [Rhizopus stolonifer]